MMLNRSVLAVGISQVLMLAVASASTNRHTVVSAAVCDRDACQDVTLWIGDGDTFTVHDGAGRSEKIRIENIDAPEIDGACAANASQRCKRRTNWQPRCRVIGSSWSAANLTATAASWRALPWTDAMSEKH